MLGQHVENTDGSRASTPPWVAHRCEHSRPPDSRVSWALLCAGRSVSPKVTGPGPWHPCPSERGAQSPLAPSRPVPHEVPVREGAAPESTGPWVPHLPASTLCGVSLPVSGTRGLWCFVTVAPTGRPRRPGRGEEAGAGCVPEATRPVTNRGTV